MSSFKQAGRLIQFNSPLGQDTLLANSIDGIEGVSRLYSFNVELLAEQGTAIDPSALVGNKATLSLALLETKGMRYFNGLVSSFEQNAGVTDFDSYSVRLVPSLWQLTLATNCRVFQNKTVMEVIKEVISPYALSLGDVTTYSYKPMDYCTQFNETDFNFISRIAEQFGIFYWFEHSANDNKVIFGDSLSAYGACPLVSDVWYVPKDHDRETMLRSVVSDLRSSSTMVTGKHTAYNYDFRTAQVGKLPTSSSNQQYGHNALERYHWPSGDAGHTKLTDKQVGNPDHGAKFVTAQVDSSDVNSKVYQGVSTARSFTAGYTFTLEKHPTDAWNRGYYLSEIAHHAVQSPSYENDTHSEINPYTNRFLAIESDRVYRPERLTPKPKMYGPQTAVVVAPAGEDNYLDKYGRVNVRFHWDRTMSANGTDNTWVRVAQPWGGPKTGTFFWPRIGDEVLIHFMDGDPDEPVLMGSVFNAAAMPRYKLPDMSTRTGLYTRSSKGGGEANANELRFEDKAGSEQIFINAERDLDLMVEHDRRTHVKNQDSLIVDLDQIEHVEGNYDRSIKGTQTESVGGARNLTVSGASLESIGGDYGGTISGDSQQKITGKQGVNVGTNLDQKVGQNLSLDVGMNHGEKVGMNYAVDSGMNLYLKAGVNLVIEAGMEICLKGPGGFITIGPAGIAIQGTMVMINSGGAPVPGTPPTLEAPVDPAKPAAPKDPDKADDGSKGGKM